MNGKRRGRPAVPLARLRVKDSAFQIAVGFVYLENFGATVRCKFRRVGMRTLIHRCINSIHRSELQG